MFLIFQVSRNGPGTVKESWTRIILWTVSYVHYSDNLRDPVTKRIRELEKINEVVKAFGKEPLDKERSSVDRLTPFVRENLIRRLNDLMKRKARETRS